MKTSSAAAAVATKMSSAAAAIALKRDNAAANATMTTMPKFPSRRRFEFPTVMEDKGNRGLVAMRTDVTRIETEKKEPTVSAKIVEREKQKEEIKREKIHNS